MVSGTDPAIATGPRSKRGFGFRSPATTRWSSVLDLHSRRLLASATSDHPDADLACDAIKIAAAVRGGRAAVDGVIFHTDR